MRELDLALGKRVRTAAAEAVPVAYFARFSGTASDATAADAARAGADARRRPSLRERRMARALLQLVIVARSLQPSAALKFSTHSLARAGFEAYVRQALRACGVRDDELPTDGELERLKALGEQKERQLSAYAALRGALANVVEGILLQDRVAMLLERGCCVSAFPLFEPAASAKNVAICAWRTGGVHHRAVE